MSEAGEWLKNHLWQIATAVLTLVCGALIGHQTNVNKIENLEREDVRINERLDAMQDEIRGKMSGRHEFMNDAAARVNFLCQQDRECRTTYDALRVPE